MTNKDMFTYSMNEALLMVNKMKEALRVAEEALELIATDFTYGEKGRGISATGVLNTCLEALETIKEAREL